MPLPALVLSGELREASQGTSVTYTVTLDDPDSFQRLLGCAMLWALPSEQARDVFEYVSDQYRTYLLQQEAAKRLPPGRHLVTAKAVAGRQRPSLVIDEDSIP
jgi:hypothetical protein